MLGKTPYLQFAIFASIHSARKLCKSRLNDLAMLNSTEVSSPNCQISVSLRSRSGTWFASKLSVRRVVSGRSRSIGFACHFVNRSYQNFFKNFWFDPLTFAFHSGEWHAFGNSEAERYRHSVWLARAFRKFLRFLFSCRRFSLQTRLSTLVCEP